MIHLGRVTGDEKWFKIAFLVGAALTLVGIILLLMFLQILNIMWITDPFRMIRYIIRKGFFTS